MPLFQKNRKISIDKTFFIWYYVKVPSEYGYGSVPEWPKGTDCKSAGDAFGGSNPPAPTKQKDLLLASLFCLAE